MSSQNPYAPPQANLQGPAATGSGVNISTLPVSDKWKARFYVIQKAGCPEKSSMNGFNVLAFFFGVSAIYASRANVDFYRKMVLNDNGWW